MFLPDGPGGDLVLSARDLRTAAACEFALLAELDVALGAPDGHASALETFVSAWIGGTDARMRPSSVIVEPSSGTLRSLRSNTVLPRRSPRSLMDFTPDPDQREEPTSVVRSTRRLE